MPQISVVIPLYNKGRYIRRALDSVLAQTFKDFEVIVVDDGSTDNGPEIVKGYADPRIRLIRQANAGPGAARNRGVRESMAPYIAFLDADDEWLPEFLGRTLSALQEHAQCVLCTSYFHNMIGDQVEGGFPEGVFRLAPDFSPRDLKQVLVTIPVGSVLCKRMVFASYGGFYENRCTYGEDSYLWLKVLLNESIYRIADPLFIYHIEASELGYHVKDRRYRPPKPYMTDPEPVVASCPADYLSSLRRFLGYFASIEGAYYLRMGRTDLCKQFLRDFPEAKKWPRRYWWLRAILHVPWLVHLIEDLRSRVKLSCPWLIPVVRTMRHCVR